MSTTKFQICSVFVIVMVLKVTSLEVAGRVERKPRQTAASQQGDAILFFAAHMGHLTDIEYNPIIFNEVVVNRGHGYSNASGLFTVPVTGIYQFVFSAQLCRGSHNNHWDFMVNGNRRLFCHAQVTGGDTALTTCFFMEELKKDDRVWVKQESGSCAWASTDSRTITFSGVLLASDGVSTLRGKYGTSGSCPLLSMSQNRNMVSNSAGWNAALSSVSITLMLGCLLLGYGINNGML